MQVLPKEWNLSYNQVSILLSGLFAEWTSGQESTGLKDHERCGSGETLMWWRVERVKEWKLWLTLSPRMNLLHPGSTDFNEVRTWRWPRTAKTDLFLQNLMQMSTRNPLLHPTLPILCFPWERLSVLKSLCRTHGGSSLKSSVRSASETLILWFSGEPALMTKITQDFCHSYEAPQVTAELPGDVCISVGTWLGCKCSKCRQHLSYL